MCFNPVGVKKRHATFKIQIPKHIGLVQLNLFLAPLHEVLVYFFFCIQSFHKLLAAVAINVLC